MPVLTPLLTAIGAPLRPVDRWLMQSWRQIPALRDDAGFPDARFLVVGAARTGSTWLCHLLNAHPDLLCHSEVFHQLSIHARPPWEESLSRRTARDLLPGLHTARIWRHPGHASAVGFKVLYRQRAHLLTALLEDPRIHKILITRRDVVRRAISRQVSLHTGVWSISRPSESAAVYVDTDKLLWDIMRTRRRDAWCREVSRGPVHEVVYEELDSDAHVDVLTSVLQFLGVPPLPRPLDGRVVRQNPRDTLQMMCNPGEVERALSSVGLALVPEVP